jgi:hypothetical protein
VRLGEQQQDTPDAAVITVRGLILKRVVLADAVLSRRTLAHAVEVLAVVHSCPVTNIRILWPQEYQVVLSRYSGFKISVESKIASR